MMDSAIIFENVSKSFGLKNSGKIFATESNGKNKFKILDDISFEIKTGEAIGVIGLNGSGKTTLLRMMCGVYTPDLGTIKVNGKMAPLLQIGTGFNNELDAEENILLYGLLLGLSKSEIKYQLEKILEFSQLEKFRKMKIGNFSNGMKARLGFATAMAVDSDILLVDEVLSVGDAIFKEKCIDTMLDLKKENKTIIFSSHSLGMIKQLCDRVLLIHNQKISKFAPPEEVLPRYRVIIERHKEKKKDRLKTGFGS